MAQTSQQPRLRRVPLFKGKKQKIPLDTKRVPTELYAAEEPAPPHEARLTYYGGALSKNVSVFTNFWGNGWANDAGMNTIMGQINPFFYYHRNEPPD